MRSSLALGRASDTAGGWKGPDWGTFRGAPAHSLGCPPAHSGTQEAGSAGQVVRALPWVGSWASALQGPTAAASGSRSGQDVLCTEWAVSCLKQACATLPLKLSLSEP